MLKETGRVVAVEDRSLWVETINQSACGSCHAEKGCGQSLLAKWSATQAYLQVDLAGRDPSTIQINDQVSIGIPENVVVQSAMLVYCLPLCLLLVGAAIGDLVFGQEIISILGALLGLIFGGLTVFLVSRYKLGQQRSQPVMLDIVAIGT